MMLRAPVTNWEPHGVTLAGYCYAMRHGMKVQIVTPFRVFHSQRYGVTVRGNVTSVYGPLPEPRPQLRLDKAAPSFVRSHFYKLYIRIGFHRLRISPS
jgi:hypothetical protein